MSDRDSVTSGCLKNYTTAVKCLLVLSVAHTIAHLGLSVYGFMLVECQATPYRSMFFTYVTYFYNSTCGNLTELFAPIKKSEDVNCGENKGDACTVDEAMALVLNKIAFGKISSPAWDIRSIMLIYIVMDSVMIFCSAYLATFFIWHRDDPRNLALYYLYLAITTLYLLVMDIVCTMLYQKDIAKTQRLDNWLDFLGVNWKDLGDLTERLGTLPSTGSMWLVLFFCGLGIFMILNAAFLICITILWYPMIKKGFAELSPSTTFLPVIIVIINL